MKTTHETAAKDPYLEGNYRPIDTEIVASDLDVEGTLPSDLEGTFVRVGSNPKFEPQGRYHWFDGDGMVHAVEIQGGKATYRNRYVRTEALAAEEEAGGPLWTGIMEPPDFKRKGGPYKDTGNTDLVYHAGKLLALWWLGGKARVIALPDLATGENETFGGRLETGVAAHPKVCPKTGEMMFIAFGPRPPYLTYGVVSKEGALTHQVPIDLPGPRSQHDLAITEHFTILLDLPMFSDPAALKQGKTRVGFHRDMPSRFGLIPRHGAEGSVRWFEASPCYIYHTINAWEEGDEVILLGCKINDPLLGDPNNPPEPAPALGILRLAPTFHKWRFNLKTGQTKEEQLDDVLSEFPRMNDALLGQKSRYSYNPRVAWQKTLLFDGVIQYDTEAGSSVTHVYPEGSFGGEVSFAQSTRGKGENEGYLLTFVANEATGESHLCVLDARQVGAEPVARVKIPQRVPTGYHTRWVAGGRS